MWHSPGCIDSRDNMSGFIETQHFCVILVKGDCNQVWDVPGVQYHSKRYLRRERLGSQGVLKASTWAMRKHRCLHGVFSAKEFCICFCIGKLKDQQDGGVPILALYTVLFFPVIWLWNKLGFSVLSKLLWFHKSRWTTDYVLFRFIRMMKHSGKGRGFWNSDHFYSRISYMFLNQAFSISSMNIHFISCSYLFPNK